MGTKHHFLGLAATCEVTLLFAASLVIFHLAGEVRAIRVGAEHYSASQVRHPGDVGTRQSIVGRDILGVQTERGIPRQTKHLVVFVVRQNTYNHDVAYWDRVTKLVPASTGVWFVGFCDGSGCNREAQFVGRPDFSLIAFGEVAGLESAHAADQRGDLLVTDNHAIITAKFPWRAHDPSATAAYLLRPR
ncbi:MAG: hypothetical protein ACRD1L_02290 [Terriglobales bacterium]